MLVNVLVVAPALAADPPSKKGDECHITAGPNDIVKRKGDVTIEAGRTVESVIALKGRVTLKKGAKVKSIIAVKGDAVIEAGAEVEESVVTLGGKVLVADGGVVHGSKLSLTDGQLSVVGDDGKSMSGDLHIDGTSLSQVLLAGVLKKIDGCVVEK
jgi:NDP-sugar pyrophosphorylase family protein